MKKNLVEEFKNPGKEYRGKPFWSWNGELEEKELKRQVDVLKEMGFGGFFMHSRSGLITEYLGEEWFDLCNKTAEYGAKVDMEPWLYDEDRWPSGCAGGIVTKDSPKYRMKSLYLFESDNTEAVDEQVAMFEARIDSKENLIEYKKIETGAEITLKAGEGETVKVLKFGVVRNKPDSSYNGGTYIDTMMLEATEKFIEITHEQYKKHADAATWSEIRGIFTDEPHRGKCLSDKRVDKNGFVSCPIFYTDDIFTEFEKRYGYDGLSMLPELYYEAPGFENAKAMKHDYIDLGCNLFNERFAMPLNKWCRENGIDFTGHVLHEDALMCQTAPNGSLMRFYENMGVPGIDNLCLGNDCFWAAKQLQSSCRQLGKKWMLSELYGCTGWSFDFRGHKAIGDWQALFGINVRCPHLSWYTMEGSAKRDYPASILHQATYYKDYAYVEDYFARFGLMMQKGEPVCDVLMINPIESLWQYAHTGWANWIMSNDRRVDRIEDVFRRTFDLLEGNLIDFDYADEQMLHVHGKPVLENGVPYVQVGEMKYRKVVISGSETLRSTTVALLRAFTLMGGEVIVLGDAPTMTDCKPSADVASGFKLCELSAESVINNIKDSLPVTVTLEYDGDAKIYSQVRYNKEDDTYVIALLNVSRRHAAKGVKLAIKGLDDYKYVENWCLEDGNRYKAGDISTLDFDINGEYVFVLRKTDENLGTKPDFTERPVSAGVVKGAFDYELDEKNSVVLDFVHAKFTDKNGKLSEFDGEVLKVDNKIRDAIGIEHRSGDSCQPWYIKKYLDEEYGDAEFTYMFNIETMPEGDVLLAAERPELIRYSVNGTELVPDGKFWIDSCLKTMVIPKSALKIGKNTVTGVTRFKMSTNLESVYVVGDFGVKSELIERHPGAKPGDHGSVYSREKAAITTLPEKFENVNTTDQNMLFYTGCITVSVTPEMIEKTVGKVAESEKLLVKVPDYVASLVKVTDNDGNNKQVLGWAPYTADITPYVKTGFKLTLVCTRKNMFGPLHLISAYPGAVAPDHFKTGGDTWSDDYVMLDSCFGDIRLMRVAGEE